MTSAGEGKFYEVVVEGHFERSHGLLLGMFLGAEVQGKLYFSHEEGVHASFGPGACSHVLQVPVAAVQEFDAHCDEYVHGAPSASVPALTHAG